MLSLQWRSYFTPRSPEYDVRQEEIETTLLSQCQVLQELSRSSRYKYWFYTGPK